MSERKDMAIAMLKDMPEEKIEFVIEFFQQLETKEKKLTSKMKAFNKLESIRKNFPENTIIDYDTELAEARDEKYNGVS